ncbi:MAG: HAMP domain-containing protein, partial [Alphaproteobacteria bacterium]|nr:HAMP domain-containing protein [Alphaproteobacteria bacterium]
MSFRLKTILGIAFIEIVLLSLLVFSSMQYLKSSNEEQLVNRAKTSAQLFATMTADAVIATDLATLDELMAKTITNPDITYIRARNADGFVLSQSGDKEALGRDFIADKNIEDAHLDKTFDVRHEISLANEVFGYIELGVSTQTLEELLQKAEQRMFGVAAIEILLVGVFGFILGGILTRQLKSLQIGAKQVAKGKLGHTITVRGKDELADTAESFNEMSRALETYAVELKEARDHAIQKRALAESILEDAVESLS